MQIILLTAEYDVNKSGGAGIYAYELSLALSLNNVKVYVITAGRNHEIKRINDNLTVEYVPTIFLPILRTPLFWFNTKKAVKKVCNEMRIDLIHNNNTAAALIDENLPLVTTIQHPVIEDNKNYFFSQRILNYLDIVIESKLVKKSKIIISTSYKTLELIKKIYPKSDTKLTLIPIGVDTNFFKPIPNAKNKLIKRYDIDPKELLFFLPGVYRAKRKGLETFVKALNNIKADNFKCLVTGKSREIGWETYINKIISQSKYKKNIILAGEITYKELPLYYSAADLTIFPSLFEGFGLPILESLACGTPILATNTGEATKLINQKNGYLVAINDISSLAKVLCNIITKPTNLIKLNNNARNSIIKKYSWKLISKNYLKIYNEIFSK